jgi:subtilisin family serine protease
MSEVVVSLRVVLLAAAAAAFVAMPFVGGHDTPARAGSLSVGYVSLPGLHRTLATERVRVVRTLPALRVAEIVSARDMDGLARRLRARPGIRFVEPTLPRDAAGEPALATAASGLAYEWQYAATRANAVPSAVQRAAAAVTIAIVDTGADLSAPDLAAKSPTTWSVVGGSTDVRDANGHGTFVASLAAGAVDNNDGIAGFGGDARLMIVQANRADTSFTDMDEANAIVWAVDHGARIVNLSLGGPTTSRIERNAIDYAADRGVLLVAAAGNQFLKGNPVEYPAALIQPVGSNGVGGRGLVVGASTASGKRAPFSGSGSYVSLVAPGVDVLGAVSSTAPSSAYARVPLPGSLVGLYGLGTGTSYAAPQVSGAAALVWAANPRLTAIQVAQILKETASGQGAWNGDLGYGVIDVAAAVAQAGGVPLPPASVRLAGKRVGSKVKLTWAGKGAAGFQLKVSEDSRPSRVLLSGAGTAAAYALTPGHTYVFTVDGVDGSGTPVASSAPYRVAVATPLITKKFVFAKPPVAARR